MQDLCALPRGVEQAAAPLAVQQYFESHAAAPLAVKQCFESASIKVSAAHAYIDFDYTSTSNIHPNY